MIIEVIASLFAILVENCTGVALVNTKYGDDELQDHLIRGREASTNIEDFTHYDENDDIFQEFDAPEGQENDPKAWKHSVPRLRTSLWKCFKSVFLIQIVAGASVGILAVFMVFLDFSTAEWCYDSKWNQMPKNVQIMQVFSQSFEGFLVQLGSFCSLVLMFPYSLLRKLNLPTLNLTAAFLDVTYRLCLQMLGRYKDDWPVMSIPLEAMFFLTAIVNNYRIARHFHPNSLRKAIKLSLVLASQFLNTLPLLFMHGVFSWYIDQDAETKVLIASTFPLVLVIQKAITRLNAQTLPGIMHPGTAHVLVTGLYGLSTVVFRVMQADLTSFWLFIGLGIVRVIIDVTERITITMRDHVWIYLYRIIRKQRDRMLKYHSPRSRRFMADVSIQIMLQESSCLVIALGFITVYPLVLNHKLLTDNSFVVSFFTRACVGLSIDLSFNTISLLIQTRWMNIAVNRVWRKRWRHHIIVSLFFICSSVVYCSKYLLVIVRDKYEHSHHKKGTPQWNCTFPKLL